MIPILAYYCLYSPEFTNPAWVQIYKGNHEPGHRLTLPQTMRLSMAEVSPNGDLLVLGEAKMAKPVSQEGYGPLDKQALEGRYTIKIYASKGGEYKLVRQVADQATWEGLQWIDDKTLLLYGGPKVGADEPRADARIAALNVFSGKLKIIAKLAVPARVTYDQDKKEFWIGDLTAPSHVHRLSLSGRTLEDRLAGTMTKEVNYEKSKFLNLAGRTLFADRSVIVLDWGTSLQWIQRTDGQVVLTRPVPEGEPRRALSPLHFVIAGKFVDYSKEVH